MKPTTISVKNNEFDRCTNVTFRDSAFYGRTGLTNVTIPDSVTSTGNHTFDGCTGLANVSIPNSVTSIGYYAFFKCTGLTNVTIPNSVTSIRDGTFYGCTGLTNIIIPDSVTSIGYYAFDGCTGLTNVTIPNSVTSIRDGAFYGCTGLTNIIIPDSVTSIGNHAFDGCTGLTEVYTNNLYLHIDAFRIKVMRKNGLLTKYNGEGEIHECYICYTNFKKNDDILILECFHTHAFHDMCIEKIKDSCPICRRPIGYSTTNLNIKYMPIIL